MSEDYQEQENILTRAKAVSPRELTALTEEEQEQRETIVTLINDQLRAKWKPGDAVAVKSTLKTTQRVIDSVTAEFSTQGWSVRIMAEPKGTLFNVRSKDDRPA